MTTRMSSFVDHDIDRQQSPRAQVKTVVKDYVDELRSRGCSPNRRVKLGQAIFNAWLIFDPFHHSVSQRWLLLDDGDVFCETTFAPDPEDTRCDARCTWIDRPDDSLLRTLEQSLIDLSGGGDGFLCEPRDEQPVFFVSDRRRRPRD
jgi:hypothetical protein